MNDHKCATLLIRVPKVRTALKYDLAGVGAAVSEVEMEGEDGNKDNHEEMGGNGDPDSGLVAGSLMGANNEAAGDATRAIHSSDGGGSESALPLASDVVSLVGAKGGPVADVGAGSEESAGVTRSDARLAREPEHREPGDQTGAVK